MTAQGELKLVNRRHEAEQWREKELIFARGLINVMEAMARKDKVYYAMLVKFGEDHKTDVEVDRMVQDALTSLRFDQDQAVITASEDI